MTRKDAAMTLPTRPRTFVAALGATLLAAATIVGVFALGTPTATANGPMRHDPIGRVEHLVTVNASTVQATGWAADPDTRANALVRVLLDARFVGNHTTRVARPDIAKARHTGPTPGFDFTVRVPTSGAHTLCFVVHDVGPGISRMLGCWAIPLGTRLSSAQRAAHDPSGAVTLVRAGWDTLRFAGWARDPDFPSGRLVVVLYVNGGSAKTVVTSRSSTAQRRAGAGAWGSFDITVPVNRGDHLGCVWLVNVGIGSNVGLGCRARDSRGGAGTGPVHTPAANKLVVAVAKRHLGQRYVWGAEGPRTFDCSGLVMFSYHKARVSTPRIAADQFAAARHIPASRAVPGDLVFYHDRIGHVFHVGIYVSPGLTIAAVDPQEGVTYQTIYAPSATYGSFTHL